MRGQGERRSGEDGKGALHDLSLSLTVVPLRVSSMALTISSSVSRLIAPPSAVISGMKASRFFAYSEDESAGRRAGRFEKPATLTPFTSTISSALESGQLPPWVRSE